MGTTPMGTGGSSGGSTGNNGGNGGGGDPHDDDDFDPNPNGLPAPTCQTVTCRVLSGDFYSLIELLTPSHGGWRLQLEGTVFVFSGTLGANGVYNFVDDRFGVSIDWSLGGGPGYGAGAALTTGPLIGWASSHVEDVTSGNSAVLTGSAALEIAGTVSVSAPLGDNGLYVDPYYGQVPATLYLGGGGGGAFADIGGSYSGTFLSDYLPR